MRNNFEAPNSGDYGWDSKGMVEWVHNPFPDEMKVITNVVANAMRAMVL